MQANVQLSSSVLASEFVVQMEIISAFFEIAMLWSKNVSMKRKNQRCKPLVRLEFTQKKAYKQRVLKERNQSHLSLAKWRFTGLKSD